MTVKPVIKSVHVVPMGFANAYLIDGDDGLTLIDAGFPRKEAEVFGAIRRFGRSPDQLKHLIFTQATRSHWQRRCYRARNQGEDLHAPAGYPSGREWKSFWPLTPAPGLLRRVLCKVFFIPTSDSIRLLLTSL